MNKIIGKALSSTFKISSHKAYLFRWRLCITASTTTTGMAATATRTSSPKVTPMAMAPPVDRPDGGAVGGAEVVAATGQVVEFSWEGGRSTGLMHGY